MRGIGNDANYWAGLQAGELRLPQCSACATWYWPAPFRCAKCDSWDFTWKAIAPEGLIYSWTRVHHPFGGLESFTQPFVTLSVELPQANGIRLFGVLDDARAPAIGAPVTATIKLTHIFERDVPALYWKHHE
jgi:uncharacterized OB-fold protein